MTIPSEDTTSTANAAGPESNPQAVDPSTAVFAASNRLERHYQRRVEQLWSRFEDIRELMEHEGAKGQRVEEEIRNLLKTFLPERYGYGSGLVIDSEGGELDRSRQQDILVLDRFFNPRLFLDEEPTVYPVDVVYAGIEVKTSLDKNEMSRAFRNIASLKRLKYLRRTITAFQANAISSGFTTPPLGFVVAYDTDTRNCDTLLHRFAECASEYDPFFYPEFVCVLNRGIIGITEAGKPVMHVYGLLEEDDKGQLREMNAGDSNERTLVNGRAYPTVELNSRNLIVDPTRTFLAFLTNIVDALNAKHLLSYGNLLKEYVPPTMRRFVGLTLPDSSTPPAK